MIQKLIFRVLALIRIAINLLFQSVLNFSISINGWQVSSFFAFKEGLRTYVKMHHDITSIPSVTRTTCSHKSSLAALRNLNQKSAALGSQSALRHTQHLSCIGGSPIGASGPIDQVAPGEKSLFDIGPNHVETQDCTIV